MNTKGSKRGNFPQPVKDENAEVKEYWYLCKYLANKYWFKNYKRNINGCYSYDMALSDAMLGLLRGIRTYNPEKNNNKACYYSLCMNSAMNNGCYKYGNFIHTEPHDGYTPTNLTDDILQYDELIDEENENLELLKILNEDFSEYEIEVLTADDWHWSRKHKGVDRSQLKIDLLKKAVEKLEFSLNK